MIKSTFLKLINENLKEGVKFVDNTKTELTEDELFCILSWLNEFKTRDINIPLAYVSKDKCLDFAFTKPVVDNLGLELYLIDRKMSKTTKLNHDF
ncbi:hypothetical protein ACTS9C_05300 [Empedobacter brevis]